MGGWDHILLVKNMKYLRCLSKVPRSPLWPCCYLKSISRCTQLGAGAGAGQIVGAASVKLSHCPLDTTKT